MSGSVLILGGTKDARMLAQCLNAVRSDLVIMSLAGALGEDAELSFRQRLDLTNPASFSLRFGGFGGVEGLVRYLSEQQIGCIVDATHPYAVQMSWNAYQASMATRIPLVRLSRAAWALPTKDQIIHVRSLEEAARQVHSSVTTMLAIGRQSLTPFEPIVGCSFVVRSIAAADVSRFRSPAVNIEDMPQESAEAEKAVLEANRVGCLVTKNSGSDQSYFKVKAALDLGLQIIVVDRPELPPCQEFYDSQTVLDWVERILP